MVAYNNYYTQKLEFESGAEGTAQSLQSIHCRPTDGHRSHKQSIHVGRAVMK